MKKLKTLNAVTPIFMTILFLIVVPFYSFSDSKLVSWLTVTFSWVSVIFSWLLYDSCKRIDTLEKACDGIRERANDDYHSYSEQVSKLIKELRRSRDELVSYQKQNEEMIKILRSYP